jgi:hypothetical protein
MVDSPVTSTRLFGFSSLGKLVLVLLLMLHDYFNSYARAHSLGIVAQIKKKGGSLLVFAGL